MLSKFVVHCSALRSGFRRPGGKREKAQGFPGEPFDFEAPEQARRNPLRGLLNGKPAAVDKPVGQPYLCETLSQWR